jgi:hypothetical protein
MGCAAQPKGKPLLTASAYKAILVSCHAHGEFRPSKRNLPHVKLMIADLNAARAGEATPVSRCVFEGLANYRYLYVDMGPFNL